MKPFILFATLIGLLALGKLSAREVSPMEAQVAASRWAAQNAPLAGGATEAQIPVAVQNAEGTTLYYKVLLGEKGMLILSADTRQEPIIAAFPNATSVDFPEGHPLPDLLAQSFSAYQATRDAAPTPAEEEAEASWKKLIGPVRAYAMNGPPNSAWFVCDEGWVDGTYNHWTQDGDIYNRYVYMAIKELGIREAYPAGCTAVAGAALIQYFGVTKGPDAGLTPGGHVGSNKLETLGGTYDWSLMSDKTARSDLVARVLYDVGVCSNMNYSSASTAQLWNLAAALKTYYGFHTASHSWGPTHESLLYTQLRCGRPVVVACYGSGNTGHTMVAAGYGEDTNAKSYVRIFMGYAGTGDSWYSMPTVSNFTWLRDTVTGISTDGNSVALCGRIFDENGSAVTDTSVTVTPENGAPFTVAVGSAGEYATLVSPNVASYTLSVPGYQNRVVSLVHTHFPDVIDFHPGDLPKTTTVYTDLREAHSKALEENKLLFTVSGQDTDAWTHLIPDALEALGDTFFDNFVYYFNKTSLSAGSTSKVSYRIYDPTTFSVEIETWTDNPTLVSGGSLTETNTNVANQTTAIQSAATKALKATTPSSLTITGFDRLYHSARYAATVKWESGTETTLSADALTWSLSADTTATITNGILARNGATGEVTLCASYTIGDQTVVAEKTVTFTDDPGIHLSSEEYDPGTGQKRMKITGVAAPGELEIVVPAEINGITVDLIAQNAFRNATDTQHVTLPDSILSIDREAFLNLTQLKTIHLSNSLNFLGWYTFKGCSGLTKLILPASLITAAPEAFDNCTGLTEVLFLGKPPSPEDFAATFPQGRGFYLPRHEAAWSAVISDNTYLGLQMISTQNITPSTVSDTNAEWLVECAMEQSQQAIGQLTLKQGTTDTTLKAARLLGVQPDINDALEVSANATLTVQELHVSGDTITFDTAIVAEEGTLPDVIAPIVEPKIIGFVTLGSAESELAVLSRSDWIRESPKRAYKRTQFDRKGAAFFKVRASE